MLDHLAFCDRANSFEGDFKENLLHTFKKKEKMLYMPPLWQKSCGICMLKRGL